MMLGFEKKTEKYIKYFLFFIILAEISLDRGIGLYIFRARSDGEVCLFLGDGNKSRPR